MLKVFFNFLRGRGWDMENNHENEKTILTVRNKLSDGDDSDDDENENEKDLSHLSVENEGIKVENNENRESVGARAVVRKSKSKNQLTLDISRGNVYDDSVGSPDSEGDILGVLDTPEVLDETVSTGLKYVPYSCIFEPLRLSELMPLVFIRNQSISLKVIEMEILPSTLTFFNQCVFTIILHHGSIHWTIKKKSRQISSLHSQLRMFKTKLKLPAATSQERQRRQSMRFQIKSSNRENEEEQSDERSKKQKRLVKFPRKSLQRMDTFTPIDVEVYLSNLLEHSLLKSHCAVLEFFEISPVSFVRHLGPKLKEGFVKKRSGGESTFYCCGGQYKRRWLVLRETFLFCISPKKGLIRTVMLVDPGFQVSHGFRHTRVTKGLRITNNSRSLTLKCDGEESETEWSAAINHVISFYGEDFSKWNRHLSFAPERKNSFARWYVDGACFMSDVADLLELAQEEIFITDWWLSPDIYLKRPDLTGKQWMLSEILRRQAARGVKVFILLYKEVELALGLNSLYSKQNLCQLNPNIKVLRHPDHYKGSLYWAHHEKMVIIDQMHAFVGGIDLCYGRWDNYRHKLVDLGHAGVVAPKYTDMNTLGRLILNTHDLVNNVSKFSMDQVLEEDPDINETLPLDGTVTFTKEVSDDIIGKNSSNNRQEIPLVDRRIENVKENFAKDDSKVNNEASYKITNHYPSETLYEQKDVSVFSVIKDEDNIKTITSKNNSISVDYNHSSENSDVSSQSSREIDTDTTSEKKDIKSVVFVNNHEEMNGGGNITKFVSEEDETDIIVSKEESSKSQFKMAKNLKAVKSLGLDLVEEMKEKKKEMKQWTERKVPGLKRTGSFDSEVGLSLSENEEEQHTRSEGKSKRLRRRIRRRAKSKANIGHLNRTDRTSSTGSLIDIHKEAVREEINSVHLWLGKDYVNWITKDLYDPQMPFNDTVNRHQTPRMPWHDISLYVEGPAARDAARHFILRWNAVKSEKVKNNDRYPYLIPKTYKPSSFLPSVLQLKHKVKCQVVRSLGIWSGGVNNIERSIYNAYVDAIKNAKHYIYIENQFFITSASIGKNEVVNNLAYHLYNRILEAHRNKETFRVYIVLPLLPAFEGQIGTPSGVAMQYILHYTYQSIIRGPNSLIGMLISAKVNWTRYLSLCSLRTHDTLQGQLVSELIYVHSKLIIVDDRLVIAGSANINDRSLLGNRDSEVDFIIEDQEFIKGVIDGKEFMRGEFAGSLRIYLFSEHLGIFDGSKIDVSDPVCEDFFIRVWQGMASRNTKIYEDVFNCVPCDAVTTFAELDRYRSKVPLAKMFPEKAKEMLKRIQGRLVMYPLMFLAKDELKPRPTNKEFLLPMEMWV